MTDRPADGAGGTGSPADPTPGAGPPAALQVVTGPVEARLREVLDGETARWAEVDPDLVAPFASLRRFVLAGGKRLRPAFCHWAFVGAGGRPDDPRVIDAGAAFEMLHAFALVHDDVMDGSTTRRSARTVHIEFAELHEEQRWRGEPRRFGEGVAILVGDLADVFADRLMAGAPQPAVAVWHELKIELNVGQYLDVIGTARPGADLATAHRIARYKSGKYTIERPLHVGAALAGRVDELAAPLSAYGEPLGEAFQLRDDVLGVWGDTRRTGKPVGDDLREGKPTPLLATALQRATGAHADLLARVGADDLGADEVAALQDLLVELGARDHIEVTIGELTDAALASLERSPLTGEAVEALTDLAHYVAARDL
jgi:geranylgeranyl diphosphate synthase type I